MTELPDVDRDPAGLGACQPQGLLRDVLTAGQVGLWSWHHADDAFFADATARRLWFLPDGGELLVEQVFAAIHPADTAALRAAALAARATGDFNATFRVGGAGGAVRWLRGQGRSDRLAGKERIVGVVVDITERERAATDLPQTDARLGRARELGELKALYQNAPVGLALLDRELRFARINAALARINGLAAEDHIGRHIFDVVPALRDVTEPLLRQVLETAEAVVNVEVEAETPREPGVQRCLVQQFYPFKDDAGAVVGIGIVCEEVTRHRRAERARDLLSRELSHRIKNLFAVISSIVRLSARGNEAAQPFAKIIGGRIEALGRAHDYVRPLDSDHDGVDRSARSLHDLIKAILEPWAEDGERIHVTGNDAAIGPAAATSLALAIHECATNAVKYGALSSADGRVEIACRTAGDTFELVWTERGGPPIDQPPIREGFGTTLARRSIAGELGGTIGTEWAPEGLTLRITAPAERLEK